MADRYWVGGSGTWDSSDTTNWSTSSGGAGGASVPGSSDNVFFDANSGTGTVTVGNSLSCRNLVTTGISSSLTLDADGGSITILPDKPTALTFDANTTLSGVFNFIIYAYSTAGTTCTLTTNGVTFGNINLLIGSTSGTDTFQLGDALTLTGTWTINGLFGTFTLLTNNHNVTAAGINPTTYNAASSVDFGTSTLTLTGNDLVGPFMNIISHTTNNIDLLDATIVLDSDAANIDKQGCTLAFTNTDLGDVVIQAVHLPSVIRNDDIATYGANTIGSLTFTQTEDYSSPLWIDSDLEITTLTVTGYSAGRRVLITGADPADLVPQGYTLTCGTATLSNVDFYALEAAGGASPFSATGDWGSNTNINFTSPVTRYAVSVGGDWTDTATWSTSSGGSSGASVPLPQDTAVFDANSSGTYSLNTNVAGEISASAFTGQLDLDGEAINATRHNIAFCDDFVISATTVLGDNTTSTPRTYTFFIGSGSHTVTTAGVAFKTYYVSFVNGTFTLGSNFSMFTDPTSSLAQILNVSTGTLDFNDYNVTVERLYLNSSSNKTVYLRSGTLRLDGTGSVLLLADGTTALDFEAGTSTILVNNSQNAQKTIALVNSNILNNLVIGGGSDTSKVLISSTGTNVINSLTSTRTAAYTLEFSSSRTYAVGRWSIFGSTGNLVTIQSNSSGTSFTLTNISGGGVKTSNFVALKDSNAVGANLWYAGAQSVDNGNNGAWIFKTYGAGGMFMFFR